MSSRYKFLAGKIDAIAKDKINAPKLTLEKVREFLAIWFKCDSEMYDNGYDLYVMDDLNSGSNDALFK